MKKIEERANELYPKTESIEHDFWANESVNRERAAYIAGSSVLDSEISAIAKRAFYKGFEKCKTGDANCYTAWRETDFNSLINPEIKMIQIDTKKMPNGQWSCYATFDGYDHAFVTDSKEESQAQMRECLKKHNLEEQAVFAEEIVNPPYEKKEKYQWTPPKIDDSPFA